MRRRQKAKISPDLCIASGLIAAGGIVGLFGVALKGYERRGQGDILNFPHQFLDHRGCQCWPSRCWLFAVLLCEEPLKKVALRNHS